MKYERISSFFWDTKLPLERRESIVKWFSSLSKEQKLMVEDMIEDTRQDAEFDEMTKHET